MRKLALAIAALAALSIAPPANAAVLVVNGGGQLTGATGVSVGGSTYTVTFADGSCNSVFGGCDSSLFAFHDRASAETAAQALLDQVLLDSVQGNFDSVPGLVLGCGGEVCNSLVPWRSELGAVTEAGALNYDASGPCCDDFIFGLYGGPADQDFTNEGGVNFAIFTLVPTVPEPATWAMMLLGFAGIGFAARRRKSTGGCHA